MITLDDMANALNLKPEEDIKGFAVYGQVKSINPDGTYQVSLNGSTTTTKCARLTGAHVDDVVLVTVLNNGYAVVTGCVGGDTDALEALEQSGATMQHFWYDANGAHVTEDTQEDYQQDPSSAGGNTLITSQGLAIRKGTTELASFNANDGIIIGKIDELHIGVNDAKGLAFYEANETTTSAHISPISIQGHLGLLLESNYASSRAYNAQILVDTSEYKGEVHIEASKSGGDTAAINLSHDGIILVTGNVRGSLETPTPSITATKGTLVAAQARRFGHVVQLWIQYRNTSSIAGGQNVFEGTLNTTALRPVMSSSGTGYFGEHAMVGFLTTAGAITIRNAASTAVTIPSTSTSSLAITYLVN